MVLKCCVSGCRMKVGEKVSFHKFPQNERIRMEWCRAANPTLNAFTVKNQRVCSIHFRQDDFIQGGNIKKLKAVAVPTLRLPLKRDSEMLIKVEPVEEPYVDPVSGLSLPRPLLKSEEKENVIPVTGPVVEERKEPDLDILCLQENVLEKAKKIYKTSEESYKMEQGIQNFYIGSSNLLPKNCRLCLSQGNFQNLKDLDTNFACVPVVIKFLEMILGYQLPKVVCQLCFSEITQIAQFVQKCLHSQTFLNQINKQHIFIVRGDGDFKDNIDIVEHILEPPTATVSLKEELVDPFNSNNPEGGILQVSHIGEEKYNIRKEDNKLESTEHSTLAVPHITFLEHSYASKNMPISTSNDGDNNVTEHTLVVTEETETSSSDPMNTILPKKRKRKKNSNLCTKTETSSSNSLNAVVPKKRKTKVQKETSPVASSNPDTNLTDPSVAPKKLEKLCKKCGQEYVTLITHYKTSKKCKPRNNLCPQCGKTFCSPNKLREHMVCHHKAERPSFMCHVCSKTFYYRPNLKRHLNVHELGKTFCCDKCGKCFSRKYSLEEHMNVHTGVKLFTCHICEKTFYSRNRLIMHEKRHRISNVSGVCVRSPRKRREYYYKSGKLTCDICNEEFGHKGALKLHRESHDPNRTYTCKICREEFNGKTLLYKHYATHQSGKPFVCEICNKSFRLPLLLTTHLRTHTGERPYACTECPKTFVQSAHLRYHMLLHKGQKSYICDYCKKAFTMKVNLTVHMRIHTGETPYKCHVCERGFRDSSMRKRHVMRQHGEDEVKLIGNVDD